MMSLSVGGRLVLTSFLAAFAFTLSAAKSNAQLSYPSSVLLQDRSIAFGDPNIGSFEVFRPASMFADFDEAHTRVITTPNSAGQVGYLSGSQRSVLRPDQIVVQASFAAFRPVGSPLLPGVSGVGGFSGSLITFDVLASTSFDAYAGPAMSFGDPLIGPPIGQALFDLRRTDVSPSQFIFGVGLVGNQTLAPSEAHGILQPGRYSLRYFAAAGQFQVGEGGASASFNLVVPSPPAVLAFVGAFGALCVRRRHIESN